MRKLFLLTFLLLALSSIALATAQAPDVLIHDNKIYKLYSNPLSDYYKDKKDAPRFVIRPGVVSSGNWRGYVATWEIADNELFLRGLDSWLCDDSIPGAKPKCRQADLKELFGEKSVKGKVLASWFTGELRIPDGERIEYVHMGYGSVYERDIIIKVEAGKVTGQTVIDNTQKERPSNLELQRQELEKLKNSPEGKKPVLPKKNT